MVKKLLHFFSPNPLKVRAQALYIPCVAQARNPFFYEVWKVPDTLDGRFDMLVLHLFLLLRAVKGETALGEALTDAFFADMDRNLRELGVGDPGVGKRVRKMLDALYGRIAAYETAWGDSGQLQDALNRNIYAQSGDAAHVAALEAYVRDCAKALQEAALSAEAGTCNWPSPAAGR